MNVTENVWETFSRAEKARRDNDKCSIYQLRLFQHAIKWAEADVLVGDRAPLNDNEHKQVRSSEGDPISIIFSRWPMKRGLWDNRHH